MLPAADGSPTERAGTEPPMATPDDVAESAAAQHSQPSETASSGEPLRRRRRHRRRRPPEAGGGSVVTAHGPAEENPSSGETPPDVRQAGPSGTG
ncbi:MAG: hypothetical protein ACREE9_02440, partial [Stellaceae bacterium]